MWGDRLTHFIEDASNLRLFEDAASLAPDDDDMELGKAERTENCDVEPVKEQQESIFKVGSLYCILQTARYVAY